MHKSLIIVGVILWATMPTASTIGQDAASDSVTAPAPSGSVGVMRFNFSNTPWPTVLEMFAETSGLSLVMNTPPDGLLNYDTGARVYSVGDSIDIMNSVLSLRGFTLLRREKMLMVLNVQDGIPPDLLETIPLSELDGRGKFEITRCIFPVNKVSPIDASEEISTIIGLQGEVKVLGQSRQVMVTGTGGRLRTVRAALQRIDDPNGIGATNLTVVELNHIGQEDALIVIRQMLGLSEEQNSDPEGSLRLSIDPTGKKILASGKADELARIGEIIKKVDVPAETDGNTVIEFPQLIVYPISDADPETIYNIVLTLFEADDNVRLATDPVSGKLIAECLPSQHATIRATLDEMQKDGREFDVIPLDYVDAQTAVISINKVYGIIEGEDNPKAPIVTADTFSSSLIVRGTADQIADIKTLLNKMGEDGAMLGGMSTASNVRMLDLTGREAQMALEQAALIWPTLRGNKIRSVTPSNAINAMNNGIIEERSSPAADDEDEDEEPADKNQIDDTSTDNGDDSADPITPPLTGDARHSAKQTDTLLVQASVSDFGKPRYITQADTANIPATNSADGADTPGVVDVPGSDIIIAPGPGGLMVTSKDTEALADFVDLLDMLTANMSASASKTFTVFYLKHETAANAMTMLNEILGAGSSGAGDGGGGLLGDLAGAALGGGGGGDLVGSLLGLGGDSGSAVEASGPFKIVANSRLNCLVVEANPVDIELMEQLLVVIDRKKSLEVIQTSPKPRIVQIHFQPATTIANILKGSYADRLIGGGGGGGQQQPNPQDIIRAMTRGRGGNNGGGGQDPEEAKKNISIEVDADNNTLIIGAPDDTFAEMKSLIDQLDRTAQTTQIIPIRNADPALVRQALGAYIGEGTTGGATPGGTPSAGGGTTGGRSGAPSAAGGSQRSAQQQAATQEFIRAMQQRAASGGGRGQGSGRGGRGGGGTGGRGGGGNRGGGGR